MQGRERTSRVYSRKIVGAVAACLALALGASAQADAAVVKRIPAAAIKSGAAEFHLRGLNARLIRRAHVRAGDYRREVARQRVKRAARRKKKLKVTLPERVLKAPPKPVLIVIEKKPDRKPPRKPQQPAPAPSPEADPAPQDPPSEQPSGGSPDSGSSEPESPGPISVPTVPDVIEDLPIVAPPEAEKAKTRDVGAPILSDSAAASRVRRSSWEPRPGNATANETRPTASDLERFRSANKYVYSGYLPKVTGNFSGTTDEIIQWAAWKWGLDEDVLRAVAAVESWWRMSAVGDSGQSFGLTQIKQTYHAGTYPMSAESTAFNADYYGALFRSYYDGHVKWLNDLERGEEYRAGDQWGSVGAHYAGRWHTAAAESYISSVKRRLAERVWEDEGF